MLRKRADGVAFGANEGAVRAHVVADNCVPNAVAQLIADGPR